MLPVALNHILIAATFKRKWNLNKYFTFFICMFYLCLIIIMFYSLYSTCRCIFDKIYYLNIRGLCIRTEQSSFVAIITSAFSNGHYRDSKCNNYPAGITAGPDGSHSEIRALFKLPKVRHLLCNDSQNDMMKSVSNNSQ